MAIIVASGIVKQISATLRHGIKLPNKNTIKNPKVAEMPAHAVRMPRIDGSLEIEQKIKSYFCIIFRASDRIEPIKSAHQISPTYVMIGASIKPTPNPSKIIAKNTSDNVWDLYIRIHAIICGILTKNMAFLRPNGSASQPEKRLPTGWQMYAMLPNHEACVGVMCKNSLALFTLSWPVSAGITIVANATASPKSSRRKFLAVLARICGQKTIYDIIF